MSSGVAVVGGGEVPLSGRLNADAGPGEGRGMARNGVWPALTPITVHARYAGCVAREGGSGTVRYLRRFGGTAVLLLVTALILAACGGDGGGDEGQANQGPVEVKTGGKITYGADQEPTGFNNNTSSDNGTSVQNVMENVNPTVFKCPPDLKVTLNTELMDSAEQTSANPQTVVYKIKQNAVWSDGVPISANDFIYMYDNMKGEAKGAPKGNDVASTTGWDQIKSVTGADGGKTVTVVYDRPFADWKSLYSSCGGTSFLASHYVKAQPGGWNTGLKKAPTISGGPYKIGNYTKGQSLTLEKNEKYWGTPAKLDQVVFRFLPESVTQPAALQNNEVDLIYPQPQLDLVDNVRKIPGVVSNASPGVQFEHLDFNLKTPGLDDLKVRQAIATGLNQPEMVQRSQGQFDPNTKPLGNRIWLPTQPDKYQDHFTQQYGKGDVAAATQMLESAGYAKGPDGIYAKGGRKLSFRFTTTAGNALRESQGQLFQNQMKAIGVDIRINNSPSTDVFGERLPGGDFDIADFAWVGGPFTSGNTSIYKCDGGQNYGKFCNPEVDRLLDQANAELDEAKAAALWNQIDQLVTDNMVTMPLFQKDNFIAYRNTYGNIGDNPSQEGIFWNAATWGLK
jgi:peptide/nickel transport system substrate-binding protein